jgi:hypothetical protein
MARMLTWAEAAGSLASPLVFGTFYMKTMIPLRAAALPSNAAFITSGFPGGLYPVLLLRPGLPSRLVIERRLENPERGADARGAGEKKGHAT